MKRMEILLHLFEPDSASASYIPLRHLARLVDVPVERLRRFQLAVRRGSTGPKSPQAEHARTCVRAHFTLEQADLRRQSYMTLLQRVRMLQKGGQHPHCNARCLRLAYKRLGVKLKRVVVRRGFRRADDYANTEKDRRMLLELQEAMRGQACGPVEDWVFVDECVFSCKTYKKSAWAQTGQNITQSEHLGPMPCLAVLAAVSMRRGLICFHVRPKSFTASSFRDFLLDLRAEHTCERVQLFADNCGIHRARIVTQLAAEQKIDFHWNVCYAPQYNGIEYVWAIAKATFRKFQLQRMLGLNSMSFEECVFASMAELDKDQVARCCRRGVDNLLAGRGADTCPAE